MRHSTCIGFVVVVLSHGTTTAQSNIDPDYKYAWAENIAWTNWADANEGADGVVVREQFLSGYLWCENVGWIKVGNGNGPYSNKSETTYGVNVAANGDLDGFAWGENIGWVRFDWAESTNLDRPRFDLVEYRFRGWGWGENVGWINLDHDVHYVRAEICMSDQGCDDAEVCTWDQCLSWVCEFTPNTYGDVDCITPINIFDLLCVLKCFAGDCSCCCINDCDIHPCEGNSTINIFDLLAVLAGFAGNDPCCGGLP